MEDLKVEVCWGNREDPIEEEFQSKLTRAFFYNDSLEKFEVEHKSDFPIIVKI